MNLPTFNIPPLGPIQSKIWGRTQLFFAHNSTESHLIQVEAGGYCSQHIHEFKWNRFVVVSGFMRVHVERENGIVDVTELRPGGITDVPPGVVHWFEAEEDSIAIEVYWVSLDAKDIDRRGTHGGKRRASEE